MIDCPVCPKTDIKEGITKCPQCGTDLSALLRARELPDVYYNEGIELAKKGLLDEAIEKLIFALELNPNSIASHIVLGKILARMSRYGEAVIYLDKALSIDQDNTGASIEKRRIDDTIENGQHSQNDLEEIGSLVTAVGLAFCIGGAICAIVTQQAIQTASGAIAMAGMGFLAMLTGINMKSMRSHLFVELGFVLALTAVMFFYIHYPMDWYYPLAGYVVLLYAAGILILIGNFCIRTFISQHL